MMHKPPWPFPSSGQKPLSLLTTYSTSSPLVAWIFTPGCFEPFGTSGIHSAGQQIAPAPGSKVIWNFCVGPRRHQWPSRRRSARASPFQMVTRPFLHLSLVWRFLDRINVAGLVPDLAANVASALLPLAFPFAPDVSASHATLSSPFHSPFALPPLSDVGGELLASAIIAAATNSTRNSPTEALHDAPRGERKPCIQTSNNVKL